MAATDESVTENAKAITNFDSKDFWNKVFNEMDKKKNLGEVIGLLACDYFDCCNGIGDYEEQKSKSPTEQAELKDKVIELIMLKIKKGVIKTLDKHVEMLEKTFNGEE